MKQIFLYVPEEALAQQICAALDSGDFSVVTSADLSLLPSFGSHAIALLSASLKWTECRPLLDALSERGCSVLFLTENRRMKRHLKALYDGRSETLVIPFSEKALRSRLELLSSADPKPTEISLDEEGRAVVLDGRRVELTAQEYALLTALYEQPDLPVSRETLLRTAWGYQSMGETRTVDVHVQRLRKKLGEKYIETVYKCGYRLKLA